MQTDLARHAMARRLLVAVHYLLRHWSSIAATAPGTRALDPETVLECAPEGDGDRLLVHWRGEVVLDGRCVGGSVEPLSLVPGAWSATVDRAALHRRTAIEDFGPAAAPPLPRDDRRPLSVPHPRRVHVTARRDSSRLDRLARDMAYLVAGRGLRAPLDPSTFVTTVGGVHLTLARVAGEAVLTVHARGGIDYAYAVISLAPPHEVLRRSGFERVGAATVRVAGGIRDHDRARLADFWVVNA